MQLLLVILSGRPMKMKGSAAEKHFAVLLLDHSWNTQNLSRGSGLCQWTKILSADKHIPKANMESLHLQMKTSFKSFLNIWSYIPTKAWP